MLTQIIVAGKQHFECYIITPVRNVVKSTIEHLMPFLNPAHRRRRECTKRQLKTEEASSPHLSFQWTDCFTKRLVTSLSTWPLLCLPSGTKPIPSPAATSDHGLLLQGFEQLAYVLEDPASNGEVGWGLMMVLLWPHSWSKFFFFI